MFCTVETKRKPLNSLKFRGFHLFAVILRGATQTVTQDSFSRVEGLVTSVQIHSANIDENTEGIVPVLKGSLEAMNAIRENTEPIPQIYELLQTIKRDGLKAI